MELYKFISIGYTNYRIDYRNFSLLIKGIEYLNIKLVKPLEPVEFDYDMSNSNKLVFRCVYRIDDKVIGCNIIVTPDLFNDIYVRISGDFGKKYKYLRSELCDKLYDVFTAKWEGEI